MAELPEPVIKEHDGVLVVRDDYIAGGTKRRFVHKLFTAADKEVVYASPVYGGAQIAIAYAAKEAGLRATIFCAQRAVMHARTLAAQAAGATIVQVPHGYLSNVQAKARHHAESTGATLLPFGLDTPEVRDALAAVANGVSRRVGPVDQVWSVGGSGVLTRGLQHSFPGASFHVVQIGHELSDEQAGQAKVYVHHLKFEQDARLLPPFPSCSNYDAKGWAPLKQHAQGRVLFWNVMSDGEPTT